jgi:histidinol-phosphate aminotransferase
MNDPSVTPNPLRPNFRAQPFWNPTHIPAHEVGQRIARMDLNECPHPPSPSVIAAIANAASSLNRYPDGTCPELTQVLSSRLDVPAEQLCYGGGSTQLLTSIAEISVAPGEELLSPELIWRRFTGVFGVVAAKHVSVPNRADGAIDIDPLLAAVSANTRLMVVLTPNNPTGMMLSEEELIRLAEQTPDHVLLFVDEAYYEFAQHAGGADAVNILKRYRKGPWVVTRTFSKAYALAGLRLGYAICSTQEMANALRLVTSTFNLTGVAEAAVLAALEDTYYTDMILSSNAVERERITQGLQALGFSPMPSVTNFVGVDVGKPAVKVVAAMRERGVRIATFGFESADTCIRASTGSSDDTDMFLRALPEALDAI